MKRHLAARDIQSYIKLAVWIAVIAYLCFSSGDRINNLRINSLIPEWIIPYIDKIVHFVMFFVLAFLIKSLYWQKTIEFRTYYIYLVFGVVYAAITELVQHYFLYTRSGDVFDFFCDLTGMTLSVLVFPLWPRFVKWFFG